MWCQFLHYWCFYKTLQACPVMGMSPPTRINFLLNHLFLPSTRIPSFCLTSNLNNFSGFVKKQHLEQKICKVLLRWHFFSSNAIGIMLKLGPRLKGDMASGISGVWTHVCLWYRGRMCVPCCFIVCSFVREQLFTCVWCLVIGNVYWDDKMKRPILNHSSHRGARPPARLLATAQHSSAHAQPAPGSDLDCPALPPHVTQSL